MAKKNKNVLNQNFDNLFENNDIIEEEMTLTEDKSNIIEEIEENNIVEEEMTLIEDKSNIIEEQINKINDGALIEDEVQPEIMEKIVLVKPKRTIDSLTKSEYRYYLRTGIIPE